MVRFFKLQRSNSKADSNVVTSIIMIPIFLMIFMSIVDVSLFFSSRSQLQDYAADGARAVAIFGGNGSYNMATPLEYRYGKTKAESCGKIPSSGYLSQGLQARASQRLSGVECGIVDNIARSRGLVNTTVLNVRCSPSISYHINETAKCSITFDYSSVPLSVFWVLQTYKGQNGQKLYDNPDGYDPLEYNVVEGTAQTEVDLSGQSLVSRR